MVWLLVLSWALASFHWVVQTAIDPFPWLVWADIGVRNCLMSCYLGQCHKSGENGKEPQGRGSQPWLCTRIIWRAIKIQAVPQTNKIRHFKKDPRCSIMLCQLGSITGGQGSPCISVLYHSIHQAWLQLDRQGNGPMKDRGPLSYLNQKDPSLSLVLRAELFSHPVALATGAPFLGGTKCKFLYGRFEFHRRSKFFKFSCWPAHMSSDVHYIFSNHLWSPYCVLWDMLSLLRLVGENDM